MKKTVSVVDMNGSAVFTVNASKPHTINFAGYAKGVYFVRISTGRTKLYENLWSSNTSTILNIKP